MTQKYYDWFGANGQKIFAMTIYFQTEKEWRRVRSYFHFLINIFAIGKFCYKQYNSGYKITMKTYLQKKREPSFKMYGTMDRKNA